MLDVFLLCLSHKVRAAAGCSLSFLLPFLDELLLKLDAPKACKIELLGRTENRQDIKFSSKSEGLRRLHH